MFLGKNGQGLPYKNVEHYQKSLYFSPILSVQIFFGF